MVPPEFGWSVWVVCRSSPSVDASPFAFPERGAKVLLENLAGARLGQSLGSNVDGPRHFVTSDERSAVSD